jgi:hypothetical protein
MDRLPNGKHKSTIHRPRVVVLSDSDSSSDSEGNGVFGFHDTNFDIL